MTKYSPQLPLPNEVILREKNLLILGRKKFSQAKTCESVANAKQTIFYFRPGLTTYVKAGRSEPFDHPPCLNYKESFFRS